MKYHHILRKCFREKSVVVAMCLSVVLLFFTSFLLDSFQAQKQYQRQMIYGFHNGAAFDISEREESKIQNHLSIKKSGEMIVYGTIIGDDSSEIGNIGTVDQNFWNLEQFQLIDGTYPAKENEVVMEYAMLDLLHLPYEIGENIDLKIQVTDGTLIEKSYVLSGIIQTYSTNWLCNDHPLLSVITKQCDSEPMQRHLFFSSAYKNENEMKELDALIHETNKSEIIFNEYSFPENIFSFEQIVENGGALLSVSAISALLLICISLSTIAKQLYRNRVLLSLGLNKNKLNRLMVMQSFQQWLICWGWTCFVSAVICMMLVVLGKNIFQFTMTYRPFVVSFIVTFLIMLVMNASLIVLLKKMNGITGGKDLTRYAEQKVKRKQHFVFDKKSFIDIEKRRMRKKVMLNRILCTGMIGMLFICMYNISTSWQLYQWNMEHLGYSYQWSTDSPTDGLTFQQLNKIQNTEGIETIKYLSSASYYGMNDQLLYVQYENALNDPYVKLYASYKYVDCNETTGLPVTIVMLPENSSIWNDIVDVTDKEEFYRGESAICFFMSLAEISDGSVQVVDSDMKEKITGTEIALHDGEMLSLKAGDHNIQVKCERVIDHLNTINVDTNITPGTIFVSEKLYCQLFDMDSLKYNEVIAYGNHHASYDVTDKLMSMINRNQSITFNNHRIEVEQMKKQIYMKIFYIGIVTVMFCLIFLVQMYQNQLHFLRSEMDRIHLLHELGMNQRRMNKMFLINSPLFALIVFLLVNGISIPILWLLLTRRTSMYVESGLSISRVIKYGLIHTNLWILWIPQVLFLLMYFYLCHKAKICLNEEMKKM